MSIVKYGMDIDFDFWKINLEGIFQFQSYKNISIQLPVFFILVLIALSLIILHSSANDIL